VLVVPEPGMHNQVVFAWTDDSLSSGPQSLQARIRHIPPRARRALAPVLTSVHAALMKQLTGK